MALNPLKQTTSYLWHHIRTFERDQGSTFFRKCGSQAVGAEKWWELQSIHSRADPLIPPDCKQRSWISFSKDKRNILDILSHFSPQGLLVSNFEINFISWTDCLPDLSSWRLLGLHTHTNSAFLLSLSSLECSHHPWAKQAPLVLHF